MNKPRPPRESLPRKTATPGLWLALIVVALAVLLVAWNLLQ